MNVITVKVIRVPGAVVEVGLATGATVQDALEAANVTLGTGEAITVNGNAVNANHTLNESDKIILSKSAKSAA